VLCVCFEVLLLSTDSCSLLILRIYVDRLFRFHPFHTFDCHTWCVITDYKICTKTGRIVKYTLHIYIYELISECGYCPFT